MCGCLNNDIRRTISPRSNSPSHRLFQSSTQWRLYTLSRPWDIGRHLRRTQELPLPSHVPFQTPHILCSGTSHTVQYRHAHSQAYQPLKNNGNSAASDRTRYIGKREIRRPTGTGAQNRDQTMPAGKSCAAKRASTTVLGAT